MVGDVFRRRDPRAAQLNREPPATHAASGRELTVAKQLIDSMATPWQPDNYRDTYREQVEDLIDRKRGGEEIIAEGAKPQAETNVVDLMEALRSSVDNARRQQPDGSGSGDRAAQDDAYAGDAGDTKEERRERRGRRGRGNGTGSRARRAPAWPQSPFEANDDLSGITKRELAELAGRLDGVGPVWEMARNNKKTQAIREARRPPRGKKHHDRCGGLKPPEGARVQKFSIEAMARQQLTAARQSPAARAATTVVGGHEHAMRQRFLPCSTAPPSPSMTTRVSRPCTSFPVV